MKIAKKFLILIVFILFFSMCLNIECFAAGSTNFSAGSVVGYMNQTGQGITGASPNNTVLMIVNTIIRFIQVAGMGWMIIRFTYEGIRYFTVSSVQAKVDTRGRLVRTLGWGVLVFGAAGLLEILYNIFNP